MLRIVTYNIHKGFSTHNKRFVLHEIKSELMKVSPDLILLQEVQGEHNRKEKNILLWPKEAQFQFLADSIWPHYAYGKNAVYAAGHHGNAILSKYPLVAWENIDVALHKGSSRSLLHAIIEMPPAQTKIHVLCIHFGLFKTEREQQLAVLCERIQSHVPAHEPLIIAGDFNDWLQQAEFYLESHLALQEIFKLLTGRHARTFPAWRPTLAVDRIYFRGLRAELCRRLKVSPWQQLSDHLPLYAEFSW